MLKIPRSRVFLIFAVFTLLFVFFEANGADKKISDLPTLLQSDFASGDFLSIVDVSASATKKTTIGEFDLRYFSTNAILGLSKGGTGATTKAGAFDALSPMTTAGDLIYGGVSGSGTRLPVGSTGYVLTVSGGVPTWAPTANASPLSTKGDVYTFSTVNARLGVGSDAQVLTADSTAATGLKWATPTPASPLTTKGDVYTYSSTNARLAAGTDGQVLATDSSTTTGLAWVDTSQNNLLTNPGFENSTATTGWTLGSGVAWTTSTARIEGKKSLSLALTAVNGDVISQSLTPAIDVGGVILEHGLWVKTTVTTLQVCALNAGAEVTATCANVPSNNQWNLINPNLNGPSSGTIGVKLKTTSSTTVTVGSLFIDEGWVGKARNVLKGYAVQTPTIQKFTTGTAQTYTTPANVLYIRVRMIGGGGGGSGSGSAGSVAGGAGTASTFGSSLLSAGAGSGGSGAGGGAGGASSLGTGPIGTAVSGGVGGPGQNAGAVGEITVGAMGAATPFAGGGAGGTGASVGGAAIANTGAGGGGGGGNGVNVVAGGGGGAGGFIDAIIASPAATYTYTVGAAGAAGAAGTSGVGGGAGSAGYIEVTEFYQ